MKSLLKNRNGQGFPDYVVILAIILGILLLLFGKSMVSAIREQIDGISMGIEDTEEGRSRRAKKRAAAQQDSGFSLGSGGSFPSSEDGGNSSRFEALPSSGPIRLR